MTAITIQLHKHLFVQVSLGRMHVSAYMDFRRRALSSVEQAESLLYLMRNAYHDLDEEQVSALIETIGS